MKFSGFVSSDNIPSKLNEVHEHFLNSFAVSYDVVFTPLQLAELREERMREKVKQDKIRQQALLAEQQQRQRQQELVNFTFIYFVSFIYWAIMF